ncbi:uroporphyrinogen decarboxylase family protein [Phosphitispora fastidiosa]|uniref:uroporphyrinogen decarboxylase family protein n=1 Tax=Phosphitispora fastidiosa TaxID=2837202 RepID=UPI001E4F1E63|nr:uroporphyrinogen decarboxylase family protein [Phosphitispora fastidiosa]MBU7006959.1 uroporphyrinogen decarboxylase [Phosphitispora fastidiosa]
MTARQDVMSPPERMQALLTGQKLDRVPFIPFLFGYTAVTTGYKVGDIYAEPEKSFRAQLLTQEMFGYDGSPLYGYASFGGWELGGDIHFPYGKYEQAPNVTRHPLSTPEAIESYRVPDDVSQCGAVPLMLRFSDLQAQYGMPVIVQAGTPFTCAGAAIGEETMLKWMRREPQLVHLTLRKVTDFLLKVIELYVKRYGAEKMMAFDGGPTEANQLISPKQFEEFALPYVAEIHDKAIAMGVRHFLTHICGEQNLNLPHWQKVNCGTPGIVSVGHEVSLETAKKMFGDKNVVAGNINTTIIQMGTPEEVYEVTKQCILEGKDSPSGFVLMAGCEVPVLAPPVNMYYMMKALRDFGFYD